MQELGPDTLNKDYFAGIVAPIGAYTKPSGLHLGSVMSKPEVPIVAWAPRVSYHLLKSQSFSCFGP